MCPHQIRYVLQRDIRANGRSLSGNDAFNLLSCCHVLSIEVARAHGIGADADFDSDKY